MTKEQLEELLKMVTDKRRMLDREYEGRFVFRRNGKITFARRDKLIALGTEIITCTNIIEDIEEKIENSGRIV